MRQLANDVLVGIGGPAPQSSDDDSSDSGRGGGETGDYGATIAGEDEKEQDQDQVDASVASVGDGCLDFPGMKFIADYVRGEDTKEAVLVSSHSEHRLIVDRLKQYKDFFFVAPYNGSNILRVILIATPTRQSFELITREIIAQVAKQSNTGSTGEIGHLSTACFSFVGKTHKCVFRQPLKTENRTQLVKFGYTFFARFS